MQYFILYRSWGVCFTYGTWFGLEALACMDRRYDLGYIFYKDVSLVCSVMILVFTMQDSRR